MEPISRRRTMAGALGAGMLAAAPPAARAAIPAADVPPPKFAVERGARLRVLRPAKFVDPDEAIFNANSRKFSEETGVEVRIDYVNWPDMPVQVAVAANTG
ncbi:MAG: carbohydrate ABC transporter substrate-binding protein, partial [Acetobacteraceae bacterium]|nr:carbohydrate ABC transporter substrate-binding protein [Acetobacteraceae bacterium]